MNNQKLTINDYNALFRRYQETADRGLKELIRLLETYKTKRKAVEIIDQNSSSLKFKFCGYFIKIKLLKNISQDYGCLQWWHIFFDEVEQKEQGMLIIEHYYDSLGNISKEKAARRAIYSFSSGFEKYFYETLSDLCHGVDEKTCSGF